MFGIKNRNRLRKQEREQTNAVLVAIRNDLVNMKVKLAGLSERLDKDFEGLEKNDMAMLESVDKWGERLRLLIEDGAPVTKRDEGVSEAQVKREWFGEDEPV